MKCAIVEYSTVHAEILPTLIHTMNTLGIEVDLFVSGRIMKNDPFVYTPGLRYRAANSHGFGFKAGIERYGFKEYDFVVFNSLEPKQLLNRAGAAKVPVLAVMHNGGLIKSHPEYASFFNDPHRRPLVLARNVSDFLSGGSPLPWIAPVLVADLPAERKDNPEWVRFCVQGNLAFDRRNYASLLDAVEQLAKSRSNFIVSMIGRFRPDGWRFHSQVVVRGLEKFFEYSAAGINKYLEFLRYDMTYRQYYRLLAGCDYILPLVDRTSPAYGSYYQEKLTSSLSVGTGMGLIPVIDAELAMLYGVTESAITYGTGALAEAMERALDLDTGSYSIKKQRLSKVRKKLLIDSVSNIKQAIDKITG